MPLWPTLCTSSLYLVWDNVIEVYIPKTILEKMYDNREKSLTHLFRWSPYGQNASHKICFPFYYTFFHNIHINTQRDTHTHTCSQAHTYGVGVCAHCDVMCYINNIFQKAVICYIYFVKFCSIHLNHFYEFTCVWLIMRNKFSFGDSCTYLTNITGHYSMNVCLNANAVYRQKSYIYVIKNQP